MRSKKIPLVVNDSIYPSIATKGWNLVFRLGFYLKETVDSPVLQTAVADVRERFPFFFVNIRKGVFNCFFTYNNHIADIVEKETSYCRPFDLKDLSKPNIRIVYNKNLGGAIIS